MKKKIIIVIVCLILLVGCNKKTDDITKDNTSSNNEKIIKENNTTGDENIEQEVKTFDHESASEQLEIIGKQLYENKSYKNYPVKYDTNFVTLNDLLKLEYDVNYNCNKEESGIFIFDSGNVAPALIDCK